ncbi:MarR family winged helix-turn-helix transcriptional regulator [Leminorella richardii]|uniref:MarR family winged helix-turn-helix transcriptional regulator n=1 Tax=Leminorella richardii TaxID=158841 RepID=UPI000DBE81CF|nr:MarR family transcriptional regulator [Leminorella richardii]
MKLEHLAFHLMRQLFQEHTAEWLRALPDLTKPQYAVMLAVAERPGIEQVELIDAAVSTKATLAEMLARMETRGLIRRERGTEDKRRRFIYLTPEGEAAMQAAIPVADSVDSAFLSRLSHQEQGQLVALLKTLTGKS